MTIKAIRKRMQFENIDYHTQRVYEIFIKEKKDNYQLNYIRLYNNWILDKTNENPLFLLCVDYKSI